MSSIDLTYFHLILFFNFWRCFFGKNGFLKIEFLNVFPNRYDYSLCQKWNIDQNRYSNVVIITNKYTESVLIFIKVKKLIFWWVSMCRFVKNTKSLIRLLTNLGILFSWIKYPTSLLKTCYFLNLDHCNISYEQLE